MRCSEPCWTQPRLLGSIETDLRSCPYRPWGVTPRLSHNSITAAPHYGRPSVERYKLRLTKGCCSHCNSLNTSHHYPLPTPKGLHKFNFRSRHFFFACWSSAMRMAGLPIHFAVDVALTPTVAVPFVGSRPCPRFPRWSVLHVSVACAWGSKAGNDFLQTPLRPAGSICEAVEREFVGHRGRCTRCWGRNWLQSMWDRETTMRAANQHVTCVLYAGGL